MIINGNLDDSNEGIPNYTEFHNTAFTVYNKFISCFGIDIMDNTPLFLDNGTAHSGYTPNITPTWDYGLIIKLNIKDGKHRTRIIFQLSHELNHYVFYSLLGLDRKRADDTEESYCSAMSLIFLKDMCSVDDFVRHKKILLESSNGYKKGVALAEEVGYDMDLLKESIYKTINTMKIE